MESEKLNLPKSKIDLHCAESNSALTYSYYAESNFSILKFEYLRENNSFRKFFFWLLVRVPGGFDSFNVLELLLSTKSSVKVLSVRTYIFKF